MAGTLPSDAQPAQSTPEAAPAAAKPVVPGAPAAAGGPMAAKPAASGAASGPLTAAEAAANLSGQRGGGAGDSAPASGGAAGATSAAVAAGAASAAAAASAPSAATPESDEGPCATDADCTFTRVAPGACCPMLCVPRAVTRKGADALDQHMKSCAKGHECPLPSCRPPRQMTTPACVQSRCVSKVRDEKGVQ